MQCNCRTARDGTRARAEAAAAAIIAQGRQVAAAPVAEPEEPMNRYIHTIPASCPAESCACGGGSATLDRILETLCCQNQLLLDLLGAVNALTAATLNARGAQT